MPTTNKVNQLTINQVESFEVYKYLKDKNLLNENEAYLLSADNLIENIEKLENYYTKTEIDTLDFITVDDIDAICGANIVAASEVTY